MASPDKKSFALRIDPVLWAQIERLASAELRSVNAQVEYLLRDAVRARVGRQVPAGKSSDGEDETKSIAAQPPHAYGG